MNKIQAGVLCISRNHQIWHAYISDDSPIYNDFPLGYKIISCGTMTLLKKGTDLPKVLGVIKKDIDSPPEIFNCHELYEETVQVDEDLGLDIDGCVVDNPKGG